MIEDRHKVVIQDLADIKEWVIEETFSREDNIEILMWQIDLCDELENLEKERAFDIGKQGYNVVSNIRVSDGRYYTVIDDVNPLTRRQFDYLLDRSQAVVDGYHKEGGVE